MSLKLLPRRAIWRTFSRKLVVLIALSALPLAVVTWPAHAAVGITMSTWADGPAGTTTLLHGAVTAVEADPDDCPAAQGDPSNGSDTVCTYLYLTIQRFVPQASIWASHVLVAGGGPYPPTNRMEIVINCNVDGLYRTLFSQLVKKTGTADAGWEDIRFNPGVDVDCRVPIQPLPTPQPPDA